MIKEVCIWLHDFRDVEHAREVIGEWIELYSEAWILERHRYRSPREVRREIEAKARIWLPLDFVVSGGRMNLSGETEAGSAEEQPAEG